MLSETHGVGGSSVSQFKTLLLHGGLPKLEGARTEMLLCIPTLLLTTFSALPGDCKSLALRSQPGLQNDAPASFSHFITLIGAAGTSRAKLGGTGRNFSKAQGRTPT